MKDQLVPVKNVASLSQCMATLKKRAHGAPNMAIIDGIPGVGKSSASMWMMAKEDGVFTRALGISSPASILESFCSDLDIQPRASNAKTLAAVVEKLRAEQRPIFIDEGDKIIASPKLIETVRDVADLSQVPVALIGEGNLEKKIATNRRLASRILDVCEFQALDDADARLVAKTLCEVEIADDLLTDINRKAKGLMRLIIVALHKAEGVAGTEGKHKLSLKDWPEKLPYFVGDTTVRSRSR